MCPFILLLEKGFTMDFLRYDSDFVVTLGKAADYIISLVLCVICCIPIVTAGASLTAMYYVSIKLARGEEFVLYKAFFKSFRENFKQATLMWIILILIIGVLAYDWYITIQETGLMLTTSLFQIALLIISVLVLMITACIFPILARFQVTLAGAFKSAFLFAFLHPVQMICILLATVAPYYIGTHYMEWFLGIWLFFAGFTLYFSSKMYVKYFSVLEKKYQPDTEEIEEEE